MLCRHELPDEIGDAQHEQPGRDGIQPTRGRGAELGGNSPAAGQRSNRGRQCRHVCCRVQRSNVRQPPRHGRRHGPYKRRSIACRPRCGSTPQRCRVGRGRALQGRRTDRFDVHPSRPALALSRVFERGSVAALIDGRGIPRRH
jgi:hypothetical protein